LLHGVRAAREKHLIPREDGNELPEGQRYILGLDRSGLTENHQGGKTGGVTVEMQIKFCNLSGDFPKISGV